MKIHCVLIRTFLVALVLLDCTVLIAPAQVPRDNAVPQLPAVTALGLSAPQTQELQEAINAHDYLTAEKILLAEINSDPHSASAGRLLALAGTVYFLDHDYLNAAIAWKKSEAIAPLGPNLRFSLAMSYIRMGHSDWARPVLESMAQQYPHDALFPYWLGRLDYDGHQYNKAISNFQRAIALDPRMARAYDNLGLCYYYLNQNTLAINNYNKAIELDPKDPWPYLNLAVTQQFLNQVASAEANLRISLHLDPTLVPAHFQLGTLLENLDQLNEAIVELRETVRLDPAYAEPHAALSRIYHRLGEQQAARDEAEIYERLHSHTTP